MPSLKVTGIREPGCSFPLSAVRSSTTTRSPRRRPNEPWVKSSRVSWSNLLPSTAVSIVGSAPPVTDWRSGLTAVTSSRAPSFLATSGESGWLPAMETT